VGSPTASTSTANAVSPPTRSNTVKCWNCEKTGHIARECGETRRLYCYRCGKVGVTVRSCPTCSGNEGESR
jgi:hypothetical protein